jgi:hypothetical protein
MKYLHLAAGFVAVCLFANVQAAGPAFDPTQLTSKHDAGIDFAKSQLGKSAANVNQKNAQNTPFYNPSPKQAAGFVSTDIFGIGSSRITECKTESKGTDKVANQECEAVNFLAKNPDNRKRFQLSSNDPAVLAGRSAINNAKKDMFSDNGCVLKTTTTPSQYRIESCNEYNLVSAMNCVMGREVVVNSSSNFMCDMTLNALEQVNCNRGVNPVFASYPQSWSVNRGTEVPEWSTRTFDMSINIDGVPDQFTLDSYTVDNYGQLWINDNLIYQNIIPSLAGDLRYSYFASSQQEVCNDYGDGGYQCSIQTVGSYYFRDGRPLSYYDDNCGVGCGDHRPKINVTPYLRQGYNKIELVCINAKAVGPCSVSLSGSRKAFVGTTVSDGCEALRQRSL